MENRILVPGHFERELRDRTAGLGTELVPYDESGVPQSDSSGASALFRWWLSEEQGDRLIAEHPSLEWIHSGSAGVDHILTPRFRSSSILLTSSAGVHAPSIAEWVVGAMLQAVKDFPAMRLQQTERRFEKVQRPELVGQRALFVGTGRIATEIAARLAPFGLLLSGVRRSGSEHPLISDVLPPAKLRDAAASADWLIVTAPLTSETNGIIGRDVIAALPPRARVINVSRGELVDEDALLDALRTHALAGAILDVFRVEPLPPDHPFWGMDQVMVLPHTTWRSPQVRGRQIDLFVDNLRRFLASEPLRNVVDVERGY
ncbi:MAG: D-2-hydroxyacid dehydrogenase [Acidobacteria bacterium]|nr:D-2-hydroxyacid dehydrogenase [Acidobacteriota bacterium]